MSVYVLDKRKKPLDPSTEKCARQLLEKGRARIHRLVPLVIRLVDRMVEDSVTHDYTIRIDPGSKTTGIAVVRKVEADTLDEGPDVVIVNLMELQHRLGMRSYSRCRTNEPNGFHRREAAYPKDSPMSIARRINTWRQYRNTSAELNRLSQRELADIGISRFDIPALARQSVR